MALQKVGIPYPFIRRTEGECIANKPDELHVFRAKCFNLSDILQDLLQNAGEKVCENACKMSCSQEND